MDPNIDRRVAGFVTFQSQTYGGKSNGLDHKIWGPYYAGALYLVGF